MLLFFADLSTASQDAFFTIWAAAAVVPWAATTSDEFAQAICDYLPVPFDTFTDVERTKLPPDLINVVLEVAVSNPTTCSNAPTNLEQLLLTELVASMHAMNAHQFRSLAFILAASPNATFIRTELMPRTVSYIQNDPPPQLRAPDKVALLRRVLSRGFDRQQIITPVVEALALQLQQIDPSDATMFGKAFSLGPIVGGGVLLSTPAGAPLPAWVSILPDSGVLQQQQEAAGLAQPSALEALLVFST